MDISCIQVKYCDGNQRSSLSFVHEVSKAALLLQLQAETTRVGLHGSLNRTECDWDHFILDFQLMVAHAKQVFDEEFLRHWHGFAFDGG